MEKTPIHIDFETRSNVDLKTASTHAYAVHPSTDVWCMAYAIGDDEVQIWKRGEPFPQAVIDAMKTRPDPYFIAHNAAFELVIWNELMAPRHGWPNLPLKRTFCTMAMAYAMSLPGSLENAGDAVGLDVKKDMEGRRLMLEMSKPRRVLDDGSYLWWDSPDKLERLYSYCKNDVVVERALEKRLLPLSDKERQVWLLDQEINNRGVMIDVRSVATALTTVASETERLDQAMRDATDGYVNSTRSIADLTDYARIIMQLPINGVAKADVREVLSRDIPPQVRRALEIRQEAAKSSTAKLKAMLLGVSPDNRVRGILQYHGAGTGRWAGRKLQPQNMPRPKLEQAQIEDVIDNHLGDPAMIDTLYGPPMRVISDCLRGMITADPKTGKELIAADYSNIEGRVLAWLAGEDSKLDIFRAYDNKTGPDPYLVAAASIYSVPVKDAKPHRPVGKVAELALGYQGGVGAFVTMAAGYDVDMAVAYSALNFRASSKQFSMAEAQYGRHLAKKKEDALSFEVFMASDLTKQFWRAAHPNIRQYWFDMEAAALQAVRKPGELYAAGPDDHRQIRFKKSGSFLFMRLPSGRKLCYPYPSIREMIPPWADETDEEVKKKPTLCYMGMDSYTKTWKLQKAYGGMLVENATQAVARDVLVDGLFQIEALGYPIVLHVHDEIVAEIGKAFGDTESFAQAVVPISTWIQGCPIVAEAWRGFRYRK